MNTKTHNRVLYFIERVLFILSETAIPNGVSIQTLPEASLQYTLPVFTGRVFGP